MYSDISDKNSDQKRQNMIRPDSKLNKENSEPVALIV